MLSVTMLVKIMLSVVMMIVRAHWRKDDIFHYFLSFV